MAQGSQARKSQSLRAAVVESDVTRFCNCTEGVTSLLTYNTHPEEADQAIADVTQLEAKAIVFKLDLKHVLSFPPFVTEVSKTLKELGTDRFN